MRSILLALTLVACDGGTPTPEDTDEGCEIPCQFSVASSGGLCQVNLFCDTTEPAAYCGEEADGTYTCECGPVAESPPSFVSDDICDLDGEARVCAALTECGNWTFE